MNENEYKIDIEQTVLGLILFAGQHQPHLVHHPMSRLEPGHFSILKHQIIFQSILNLYEKGEVIDIYTVNQYLIESKQFNKIGSRLYIIDLKDIRSLTDMIASVKEMDYFLDRLINLSKLEKAKTLTDNMIKDTADLKGEQIQDYLLQTSRELSDMAVDNNDIKVHEIADVTTEVMKLAEEAKLSGATGIPTGYSSIDDYIIGFQPSELIIIGARTGVGKTALALNLTENICIDRKIPGLFMSLEMDSVRLTQRLISSQGDISTYKIRKGNLNTDEAWSELTKCCMRVGSGKLKIIEGGVRAIPKLFPLIKTIVLRHEIQIVFIDYLQLLDGGKKFGNRVEEVTYISKSLKALAMELSIPVVALAQLSRASVVRGGRPMLHDLRDSGSIEQDADTVIFIHRESDKAAENQLVNDATFEIAKYRHGYGGVIDMEFIPNRTRFVQKI